MCGMVWREGDLFSHDLVFLAGPASNPLPAAPRPPPSSLSRRALSATRLAVRASLGHSGIPLRHPLHPPPPTAGCLLPSEDFHPCSDAPSLGRRTIRPPPMYRHRCVNTSPSLTPSSTGSVSFLGGLSKKKKIGSRAKYDGEVDVSVANTLLS